MQTLALSYGVDEEEIARLTNENVARIFGIKVQGATLSRDIKEY